MSILEILLLGIGLSMDAFAVSICKGLSTKRLQTRHYPVSYTHLVGTAVMTVFGSFFNAWFLIPRFAVMYGMPLEAIVSMGTQINGAITNLSTLVLFAVVPFNLLKGVLVSLLTFFLYKRVEKLFFRKKHTA